MAELRQRLGDVMTYRMVPGDRGIFDVALDGRMLFSKYETGRFPEPDEIVQAIAATRP